VPVIRRIGNSLGVIIPRGQLRALGLNEGDHVEIRLEPVAEGADPEAVEIAKRFMEKHKKAFRELAK